MTDLSEMLAAALAEVDGVTEGESMFSDRVAYWVNGAEIAHFESSGAVEVRLTRRAIGERRSVLKADPRVELRRSGADWLTVHLRGADDVPFVVDLVRIAEEAHRAPRGVTSKPPPTGAALARRKRFH